jgi:N-methylhydantoinase A/oxoprolinase/acetone carboxylase beta subunit
MRIGVDVGGTNTDAVLMDGSKILSSIKASTSPDVTSGIVEAISYLLNDARVVAADIKNVMIGTTHFTNALVERRHLSEVAIIRLASPSGHSVQPKIGWPEDLAEKIGDHIYLLPGGYEFDGREIAPFDSIAVRAAAKDIAKKGLTAAAISCAHVSLNSDMEKQVAEILLEEIPNISLTLSSDIGRIGLLERENSAIINAACAGLARLVIRAFGKALHEMDIEAPFYISQNDGTLIPAHTAEKFPIFTFASGPTNSIRGAAFLSGIEDGIVLDIGGTTCDIGVLQHGFPRESSIDVDVGGVRTNFRMPDVLAVGLGGGTVIRSPTDQLSELSSDLTGVSIGPDSVGYQLLQKALVFGGNVLTSTDIAVAADPSLNIGDASKVAHLSPEFITSVKNKMHQICSDALDHMKTSADDVPVILVGGGNMLISEDLPGSSQTLRPKHASVANAVGAAIAQVSGEVDQLYSYAKQDRKEALADAKDKAVQAVIEAGGIKESIKIVEIEEIPMAYVPGEIVRIKVKAVAELRGSL